MIYTLRFFSLQNAVCFIIITYLVPVLFTFIYRMCYNLKKNNSGAKRLILITFPRQKWLRERASKLREAQPACLICL